MRRSKFLEDEKAAYFPRTRQVLIEYPMWNNGRGNVRHERDEKKREREGGVAK